MAQHPLLLERLAVKHGVAENVSTIALQLTWPPLSIEIMVLSGSPTCRWRYAHGAECRKELKLIAYVLAERWPRRRQELKHLGMEDGIWNIAGLQKCVSPQMIGVVPSWTSDSLQLPWRSDISTSMPFTYKHNDKQNKFWEFSIPPGYENLKPQTSNNEFLRLKSYILRLKPHNSDTQTTYVWDPEQVILTQTSCFWDTVWDLKPGNSEAQNR